MLSGLRFSDNELNEKFNCEPEFNYGFKGKEKVKFCKSKEIKTIVKDSGTFSEPAIISHFIKDRFEEGLWLSISDL